MTSDGSPVRSVDVMNPHGLSPQATRRLRRRAESGDTDLDAPPITDRRAYADHRQRQHAAWGEGTVDGEVEHHPSRIGERPALTAGPDDGPVVLYLHSGGYCMGSPGVEAPITARLARRLRIVSLDYRLAPEHPYPAGLEDAERAYRELADRYERVAVAGCSAGANLAVGVARRCRDRPVAALALLCPHLDFGTIRPRAQQPYETAYLAGHRIDDPDVSPAGASRHELADLPPTLVQWSEDEPMAPDIAAFVATARSAEVPLTAQVWRGLWHAWHFHRELPEAWSAVDAAADWLHQRLAG